MNNKLVLDLTLYSVGPLSAIVAARRGGGGIQTWIKYESAVSLIVAVVLLVRPDCCLKSLLFDQSDQIVITNHLAITLITSIISSCLLINSLDEAVFYGHLWSRLFINSLIFIESLIAYSHHSDHRILCTVGSFYLFNLAITVHFLCRLKKPRGSNPFEEVANQVAKVEAYLLLIQGVVIYAQLPLFSLVHLSKSYYSTSQSVTRVVGVFILGSSFESFCLNYLIYLRDKRTFMKSRTLVALIQLAFLISLLAQTGFYPALLLHLTLVVARLATVAYGFIHTPNDPLQQNTK